MLYFSPNNSINSHLKCCSTFKFYYLESIQLQENLKKVNRNTSLAYFVIYILRNKPMMAILEYQSAEFLKLASNAAWNNLLMSVDVSVNPGFCQIQFNDDKIWEPLSTWGCHFCHLNIVYYLKLTNLDITNHIKPAILGITESKLDSSFMNASKY